MMAIAPLSSGAPHQRGGLQAAVAPLHHETWRMLLSKEHPHAEGGVNIG